MKWTKQERKKLIYSVMARVGGVVGLLGAAIVLPLVGTNAQDDTGDMECPSGYHKEGEECKLNVYTLSFEREDGINVDPIEVEYGSIIGLPGYIDYETENVIIRYDSEIGGNKLGVGGRYLKYNYLSDMTLYGKNEDLVSTTLLSGSSFKSKLSSLAGSVSFIKYIVPSNFMPDNVYSTLISTSGSIPVYARYKSGTIYYYSEANNIQLNSDSSNMFSYFNGLQELDLSNLDAHNVTNMSRMFESVQISGDLNMGGRDISSVTNVDKMFYRDYTTRSKSVCEDPPKCRYHHIETGINYKMPVIISGNLNMDGWDLAKFKNKEIFGFETKIGSLDINNLNISGYEHSLHNVFNGINIDGNLNMNNWTIKNSVIDDMFPNKGTGNFECKIGGNVNMNNWNLDNAGIHSIFSHYSYYHIYDAICNINGNLNMSGWNINNSSLSDMLWNTKIGGNLNMSGWNINNSNLSDMLWNTKITGNLNMNGGTITGGMNGIFKLITISGDLNISNFDTSNVTDMSSMFESTTISGELDLSNFDTSNVTNMSGMFYSAIIRGNLDLSNFDTSNVTDMNHMFAGNSLRGRNENNIPLGLLDLSNFDTSNVTDMSSMFESRTISGELDLSNFDTSNVTDMSSMFKSTTISGDLNISNFDTSNVTDMSSMFESTPISGELDLSNFDTSNVTDMSSMFAGTSITELDLSSFDTSKVSSMEYIFRDCPNLKTIYASDTFVTDLVPDRVRVFSNVPNLVGGVGTIGRDAGKIYARIDRPRQPGLFTDKNDTKNDNYVVFYVGRQVYTYQTVSKSGGKVSVPENPEKIGYKFEGWYKDTEFTQEYDFDEIVTSTTLLYAKMEYLGAGDDEYGIIVVERPENMTEGVDRYIIMESNLGAIPLYDGNLDDCRNQNGNGYGAELDKECASDYYKNKYGYYYQWGNNHGFTLMDSVGFDSVDTTCEENGYGGGLDCEPYSRENPYNVGEFIYLRGGDRSRETNDELRGAETNTNESRQGPCPDGWHIPSIEEWEGVIDYLNGGEDSEGESGYGGNEVDVVDELGLKMGGYIDTTWDDEIGDDVINIDSEGEYGYYWTTTTYYSSVYALRIEDGYIDTDYETSRDRGAQVRCFKNDVSISQCPEGYTMELGECINEKEEECREEGIPENAEAFPGFTTVSRNGEDWTLADTCEWSCKPHYHENEAGDQCDIDTFKITFYDEDGETVLDRQTVDYGENVTYGGDTPSKEKTQQYTYTFDKWYTEVEGGREDDLSNVTSNRDVYARYNSTVNKYTITFYDEDGETVLDRQTVDYGENVTYGGDTPSKAATQQYTYTFDSWYTEVEGGIEDDLSNVTSNRDVCARYNSTVNKYKVMFVDEDGTTVIKVDDEDEKDYREYDYGTPASEITLPSDPVKASDSNYRYTFAGWTGEISDVTKHVKYIATYTATKKTSGGVGGPGGGNIQKQEKDNCPDGDYSDSYYDGKCGEKAVVGTGEEEKYHGSAGEEKLEKVGSIEGSEYTDELNEAYQYAYSVGITTMPTIQQANMMGPLLRKHLAKMVSEFAMQELGIIPNTGKVCKFTDTQNEDQEMQYYTELACQLEFMGLHADGITVKDDFNPNDEVTRAEFGTVLSRLLWKTKYSAQTGELYYQRHLEALKEKGIMTQIYGNWPMNIELRGYVMLMLKRVNENQLTNKMHGSATESTTGSVNNSTGSEKIIQTGQIEKVDEGVVNVWFKGFTNGVLTTTEDSVHIVGTLDPSLPVSSIRVTHTDTKGKSQILNYKLSKYEAASHYFWFNASVATKSLTVNDKNNYKFDFYDENDKLLTTKTVVINQK